MLKTETQTFGDMAPTVIDGKVIQPGRPGFEITSTQRPCSAQREVFAWLLKQAPGALPSGLAGGIASQSESAVNFAYQWARGILSADGGIAYLQKTFGGRSVVKVDRGNGPQPYTLDEGMVDELFGADFSILLEWLVWSLIFNFSDVVNLMPEWGKGIASTVAAAMMGASVPEAANPESNGQR